MSTQGRPLRDHLLGLLSTVALIFGTVLPSSAHHSVAAEFDDDRPVVVTGGITGVAWVNPHIRIRVNEVNPDGSVVEWEFEGGAPNRLVLEGVTRGDLAVGQRVTIEGIQAKDRSNRAAGRRLVLASGRELNIRDTWGMFPPGVI